MQGIFVQEGHGKFVFPFVAAGADVMKVVGQRVFLHSISSCVCEPGLAQIRCVGGGVTVVSSEPELSSPPAESSFQVEPGSSAPNRPTFSRVRPADVVSQVAAEVHVMLEAQAPHAFESSSQELPVKQITGQ